MSKTFFVTLRQLVVPAGTKERELAARAALRLGVPKEDIVSCRPLRRSLDARRRRGAAVNVYHLRVELPNRHRHALRKSRHLDLVFEKSGSHLALSLTDPAPAAGRPRPVIAGAGPAGLFAALRLARAGWKPILLERGDDLERRRGLAAEFWRSGDLDPESNVLFGLGGAGLFSDGKLTTRHKDRAGIAAVLANLVEAGAPESILVEAEPHVGTDLLGDVVERLADEIRRHGGDIHFRTRLDRLLVEDGRLRAVSVVSGGTERRIDTDALVLATGHSARDVYTRLWEEGLPLEAKPFAIGVRVEMPQEAIDASQRGPGRRRDAGAASFRLSRRPEDGAGACYTFCMCPGGVVIPCASEPGRLAVNGMSRHARAGEWGNAAFLSPVDERDIAGFAPELPPALRGMALQRHWEERAFAAGRAGGDYAVPACRLTDFLAGEVGTLPEGRTVARAVAADLRCLMPEKTAITLAAAVPVMLRRLRAVRHEDVVLYAIETRTSSPVRVPRKVDGEVIGCCGVFPAGEGSGYAGGITTAALDGWSVAEKLMTKSTA